MSSTDDDMLFAQAMATLGVDKPRQKTQRKASPSSTSAEDEEARIRAMALGMDLASAPGASQNPSVPDEAPRRRQWGADLAEEDALFEAAMGGNSGGHEPPSEDATAPTGLERELVRAHVGTPKALRRRIKQGVIDAQDELDLHGLSKVQAYEAVAHFIRDCIERRLAVVRIITGRGLHSAETAVLKEAMAQWARGPLQASAYATCTAPASHGGEGVTYVFLRRFAQ